MVSPRARVDLGFFFKEVARLGVFFFSFFFFNEILRFKSVYVCIQYLTLDLTHMIEVSSKFLCCLARISQPRGDLNQMRSPFITGRIATTTHDKSPTNAKLVYIIYIFIYFFSYIYIIYIFFLFINILFLFLRLCNVYVCLCPYGQLCIFQVNMIQ